MPQVHEVEQEWGVQNCTAFGFHHVAFTAIVFNIPSLQIFGHSGAIAGQVASMLKALLPYFSFLFPVPEQKNDNQKANVWSFCSKMMGGEGTTALPSRKTKYLSTPFIVSNLLHQCQDGINFQRSANKNLWASACFAFFLAMFLLHDCSTSATILKKLPDTYVCFY